MSNETHVVVIGNATGDAQLRFFNDGTPVASFTVAHSDRVKNGDQWEDGPASFYRVSARRKLAEGVAEAVHKGQRVIVSGTLKPSVSTDKNGKEWHNLDIMADEVGTSVLFAGSQRQPGAPQTSAGWSGPTSQNRWPGQGGPITGGVDPWAAQGNTDEIPF